MATEKQIEAAARAICRTRGFEPDTLHQHTNYDVRQYPVEDGFFISLQKIRCPMHFAWRKYIPDAKSALNAAEAATQPEP